jgi:hypothetical protein
MNARERTAVHQLLGRLVYHHVLFVEPHTSSPADRLTAATRRCCNHNTAAGPKTTAWDGSGGSAWKVLVEVSDSLLERTRCQQQSDACCATCVVAMSAASIVRRWIAVELEAYGQPVADTHAQSGWVDLAASQMAGVFKREHHASCSTFMADDGIANAPSPDDLPLTSELISLWADPGRTDAAPVASWLNHCSGLADVARIVESRRTAA